MRLPHAQRFVLTGLFTVFPLWLTWVVFSFVFTQLSKVGAPLVDAVFGVLSPLFPKSSRALDYGWLRFVLAVLLTLASLYLLGALANRVLGKRLLTWIDELIARIPFVQAIYGGSKKLLAVMQAKPEGAQRVVLIDFPNADMKAIGIVTRVVRDKDNGRELAAVYVPTTPNPTSGYLEIVPLDRLIQTDWSVDQAMAFIISGGAVSPENIPYQSASQPENPA